MQTEAFGYKWKLRLNFEQKPTFVRLFALSTCGSTLRVEIQTYASLRGSTWYHTEPDNLPTIGEGG